MTGWVRYAIAGGLCLAALPGLRKQLPGLGRKALARRVRTLDPATRDTLRRRCTAFVATGTAMTLLGILMLAGAVSDLGGGALFGGILLASGASWLYVGVATLSALRAGSRDDPPRGSA